MIEYADPYMCLLVLWRQKRDGRNGKNVTFLAFNMDVVFFYFREDVHVALER